MRGAIRFIAVLITLIVLLGPIELRAGDPNADKVLTIPSPEASLAALTTAEGYQVNLYASEAIAPLYNPIGMTIDPVGRIWVITSPTYPHYDPGVKPKDKILVFEDTDGDGVADEHTVFADDLYIPTGIALDVKGGVWVGQQPDLWYMEDTDGDLVADSKRVVLHGFGTEDSHHALSAFTWGPDGAFYFNEGVFHHSQIETPYGPIRAVDAAVFRYKPSTQRLTVASHRGYNNPWGHAFDRWGQSVLSDASDGHHYNFAQVIPAFEYPNKIAAPKQLLHRGRPMAGNVILSSRHFPDDVQGTHLNNQSIGFHGTRWDRLIERGSGFGHESLPDLLVSSDFAFRPVAAEIGADGAVYILDFCNRRIGHMQYTQRDPARDYTHGRIWRVTHRERALLEPKKIVGASVPELVALLTEPENHVRHFARRELQTRPTAEVEPVLAEWMSTLDTGDAGDEQLLCEALWIYAGRDRVRLDLVEQLLGAQHPLARAAAMRVVRHWTEDRVIDPADSLRLIARAVRDPNERVRLEGVVACGFVPSAEAAGLALLASDQPMDENHRTVLQQTLSVLEKYGAPPAGVGRRFQLFNLSREELSAVDRDEAVAVVQLERADLAAEVHTGAVEFLSRARGATRAEVLITEVERLDPQGRDASACVTLLSGEPSAALRSLADRLANLARSTTHAATRMAAIALLLGLERDLDTVAATGLPKVDVIESVPAVRDEAARAALYGQLESLIESGDLDLRRAAMRSAVQLGGQRRETFERLAGLIDGGDPVISRSAHMAMNEVAFVDWPNGFEEHRMPVIDAEVLARGREVFHREGLCVTCHQPHGKGVAGSYPPLNGTPRVLGSDRTLARIVLHGLRGRISVHGATYRSAMAPLGPVLADAEVADVLTYVRNEWGNRASRVNEATVAEIRATERRRTTGWTDAQLASAEIEDQLIAMRAAGDDDSEGAMVAGPDGASGIGKIGIWVAVGVIGLILLYMIGSVVTMGSDKRESAGV